MARESTFYFPPVSILSLFAFMFAVILCCIQRKLVSLICLRSKASIAGVAPVRKPALAAKDMHLLDNCVCLGVCACSCVLDPAPAFSLPRSM